jgi:hypothetical protein
MCLGDNIDVQDSKSTDLALGTTYQVCLLHSIAEMSKVHQVKRMPCLELALLLPFI